MYLKNEKLVQNAKTYKQKCRDWQTAYDLKIKDHEILNKMNDEMALTIQDVT